MEERLLKARLVLPLVALGSMLAGPAAAARAAAAEPPVISKPKPAPPEPADALPLPPAYFDPSLAIGGEDVKAKMIETRLNVDVQVNGHGPYRFIVDSGADTSVVGIQLARELQLPLGTPVILNGMTGRNIVDRVRVDDLDLGPVTIHNLQLPALRENDLGGDGMLGIDALVNERLMMDFEKRVIKVEDASTPYHPLPGEIVVTARRQRGQLILTHVLAAGLPLDAVIDTGTEITIGNLALRDKLIRGNRDKFLDVKVLGVTGETVTLQMARIAELQLGPIKLTNIAMAFADVPPFKLFGLSDEPALLLGTDVLENFRRISLDFKSRKVRFQLRRCKPEGIILSTDPDNFSRLSSTATEDVCGR